MSEERAHEINVLMDGLSAQQERQGHDIYKECGLCRYAVAGSTRQMKASIGSTKQP
jgi:hypothetical protein